MTLKYFDTTILNPLVEELFFLSFSKEDVPFESTVLPICSPSITYIYRNGQSIHFKEKVTKISSLTVTGQFYESYQFEVKGEGESYGIVFHPTALHKISGQNIYKIKNKHLPLEAFSDELHQLLNPIFLQYKDDIAQLTTTLESVILDIKIETNRFIAQIDNVIDIIREKEGMLNTYDLLDTVDFSQKTLETQFKKIVGLTPGKYIRLHRFLKLMRKYEGKEIDLKDLIHMYNYCDHSHFVKDFKHFMKQSPKAYFKSDHPFLNEYLNK